jgi:large subunit ribosomal protein L35
MPKQKRHSGAKKRFKVTGTGKLLRRKAMNHYLGKKSAKRKRSFAKDHAVHRADAREVKRVLGGGQ